MGETCRAAQTSSRESGDPPQERSSREVRSCERPPTVGRASLSSIVIIDEARLETVTRCSEMAPKTVEAEKEGAPETNTCDPPAIVIENMPYASTR